MLGAALLLALTGCRGEAPPSAAPAETPSGVVDDGRPYRAPSPDATAASSAADTATDAYPIEQVSIASTRAIQGNGPLWASLETSLGVIDCQLFELDAPRTVDNFVSLARGLKRWRDPTSGEWVERPFYDGLIFHRVLPGVLIQSGDASGTGMGQPGYRFDDEIVPRLRHDAAGVLAMAKSGPNGNGSQFYITDGAAPAFDGRYTIFGRCEDLEVIHAIASVDTAGSNLGRPKEPPILRRVVFSRR